MKTKRQVYEDCTLKMLSDPNGTRMDIVFAAMEQYAIYAIQECAKEARVTDPYQEGRRYGFKGDVLEKYIQNNPAHIDERSILDVIKSLE